MAKSNKPKRNRNVKEQTETTDNSIIQRVSQDTPQDHPDYESRVKEAVRQSKRQGDET